MKMFVLKFLLLTAFSIVSGYRVDAQLPMAEGPTKERSQNDSERDLEERIANMRYLLTLAEKRGASRKRDPKLALAELQEDFTRLQVVNKDLVLTTARSNTLDLKFIEKSALEINRRSSRLMYNLALPEPENVSPRPSPQPITNQKQLRASITSLGSLIYWFAKNPIFKEVNVIEPTPAIKARADLERIVELSIHVKKSVEQMRKGDE